MTSLWKAHGKKEGKKKKGRKEPEMLEKDIAVTTSRPTSGFPFFRAVVVLFRPFSPLNLQMSPESPAKPQIFSRNLQSFALLAACAACHGLFLLSPAPENSVSCHILQV